MFIKMVYHPHTFLNSCLFYLVVCKYLSRRCMDVPFFMLPILELLWSNTNTQTELM